MKIEELRQYVDGQIFNKNPIAFVCTPETWRKLQGMLTTFAVDEPYKSLMVQNPFLTGTPIRVEEDPKLQPGEVLLEIDGHKED